MFVEHHSTSGTKIYNRDACGRAVLRNYGDTGITVAMVIIRTYNASIFFLLTVFPPQATNSIWTLQKILPDGLNTNVLLGLKGNFIMIGTQPFNSGWSFFR
jgi:hypothetical protein